VDVTNNHGQTALRLAGSKANMNVVGMLLEKGAALERRHRESVLRSPAVGIDAALLLEKDNEVTCSREEVIRLIAQ
jgi:ankyrin repeat protein